MSVLADNSDIYVVIFQSLVTQYAESSASELSYIMKESIANFSYSHLIE